jgi:hypothetical protein
MAHCVVAQNLRVTTMPSPTLQDEAQTVMRKKLTNGTGNRSSHVALCLFIAVDEHDPGRFDIGYPFRKATNPVTAYVGLEGICFSSKARSMFVGMLPNACLTRHSALGQLPGKDKDLGGVNSG